AGLAGTLGEAHWRVLWPRGATPAGNDASVVVEVTGGSVPASLFLGDLSAEGQRAMAGAATLRAGYAVVKVAHHGSADQDAALYRRLRPAAALVSVGENTYGHPRAETLDLLAAVGARTFRTDLGGLTLAWNEEGALRVWHERTTAAVAPDG
ncbi:MAG: competence protein ComEC, partial [Microbacterium sp.]